MAGRVLRVLLEQALAQLLGLPVVAAQVREEHPRPDRVGRVRVEALRLGDDALGFVQLRALAEQLRVVAEEQRFLRLQLERLEDRALRLGEIAALGLGEAQQVEQDDRLAFEPQPLLRGVDGLRVALEPEERVRAQLPERDVLDLFASQLRQRVERTLRPIHLEVVGRERERLVGRLGHRSVTAPATMPSWTRPRPNVAARPGPQSESYISSSSPGKNVW